MNWETFMLNELLVDSIEVQEQGKPFAYCWILILIYFVAWDEPPNYQGMEMNVLCHRA